MIHSLIITFLYFYLATLFIVGSHVYACKNTDLKYFKKMDIYDDNFMKNFLSNMFSYFYFSLAYYSIRDYLVISFAYLLFKYSDWKLSQISAWTMEQKMADPRLLKDMNFMISCTELFSFKSNNLGTDGEQKLIRVKGLELTRLENKIKRNS